MRTPRPAALALLAVVLVPATAGAQMVKLTPKIGGHFASSSVEDIGDQAEASFERQEVSSLALGANLEIDLPGAPIGVRGDVLLGTDTEASVSDGVATDSLESSLVAVSGDLVVRPLSFLPLLDPYVLGGAGFTSTDYAEEDLQDVDVELPSDRNFALHAGLGTDVKLGGVRLQAEATDYITGIGTDGDVRHDVFVTAGLGFSLF